MDPIKIDVVGSQPLEARLHRLHHVLAVVAGRVRVCSRNTVGVFRGQYNALTVALHKFAQKRFARPVGVDIGSVDKIAASLAKRVVHFSRLILGRAPAPVVPEGHRSERQFRHPKSAIA